VTVTCPVGLAPTGESPDTVTRKLIGCPISGLAVVDTIVSVEATGPGYVITSPTVSTATQKVTVGHETAEVVPPED
jgi:hypothetical protein